MFKPTKRRKEILWQINIIVYRIRNGYDCLNYAGTAAAPVHTAGGAVIKRQGVA